MATRKTMQYVCDRDGYTSTDRKKVPARVIAGRKVDLCGPCYAMLAAMIDGWLRDGQYRQERPFAPPPSSVQPLTVVNGGKSESADDEDIRAWCKSRKLKVANDGPVSDYHRGLYARAHNVSPLSPARRGETPLG